MRIVVGSAHLVDEVQPEALHSDRKVPVLETRVRMGSLSGWLLTTSLIHNRNIST